MGALALAQVPLLLPVGLRRTPRKGLATAWAHPGAQGSVPRSLGREGRLQGHFALPRADVVGLAQWSEAAGRFAVTTGAKLGWPREGKSRGEGMCD